MLSCCYNGWSCPFVHAMKANGRVEVELHSLTSALHIGDWAASRRGPLYPQRKTPQYSWNRRRGGPQQPVWTRGNREKNLASQESKNYSSALGGVKVKVTHDMPVQAQRGEEGVATNDSQSRR
jgi:hypothetical protein